MSELRLTILLENQAAEGLEARHGLAVHAALADCGGVLVDAGPDEAAVLNARRLGVELGTIEAVVLSHAHNDHTGGLAAMLEAIAAEGGAPSVYYHPEAMELKYSMSTGVLREIGVPPASRAALAAVRCVETPGPARLPGGLRLTGVVPRRNDFEDTGGAFYTAAPGAASAVPLADGAELPPDPLTDDQAVFMETAAGTVVILGCAHAGIINTLEYIRDLTDGAPLHAVVGGLHLLHAGAARMEPTIQALRRLKPRWLLPCHCTGEAALETLHKAFDGDPAAPRILACSAGTVLEFPM